MRQTRTYSCMDFRLGCVSERFLVAIAGLCGAALPWWKVLLSLTSRFPAMVLMRHGVASLVES